MTPILSGTVVSVSPAREGCQHHLRLPVRVDDRGQVTAIGLLLRVSDDGRIMRELVSGRVLHHERLRDAILRHVEKDLGPMALPRVPVSPQPFTIAEYFPTPGVTPFHDPRQHAVSLAYVVPVTGDCAPQQDALDLPRLNLSTVRVMSWWSREAASSGVGAVPPRRAGR